VSFAAGDGAEVGAKVRPMRRQTEPAVIEVGNDERGNVLFADGRRCIWRRRRLACLRICQEREESQSGARY